MGTASHNPLNKDLQLKLLNALQDCYPDGLDRAGANSFETIDEQDERLFYANLRYLEEHGLIRSGLVETMDGMGWQPFACRLTAKGLDSLLEDGGLTAYYNVSIVKLHQETLVALLEAQITKSDATPEKKESLLATLRSLPSEAIKHLTMNLVERGLAAAPLALASLETLIHQLQK